MSRTVAYPILALAVVAITILANYSVYVAGQEWFVLRPDPMVVVRNVIIVGVTVFVVPFIIPAEFRKRSALTLLLVATALIGVGAAMQFRLGHDVSGKVSAETAERLSDSIRALYPTASKDSLLNLTAVAIRRANARLRSDFDAARIDTRLARSLEHAYGPAAITREVLDNRREAPSDSTVARFLPPLAMILAVLLITRFRLVHLLSRHWSLVGVWGSLVVATAAYLYLTSAGGVRGASFAPQEMLKITLPVAWAGLLVRYHDALASERRDRFTRSPLTLWVYILLLLSAPLAGFVLARDFGQFLVIGVAQTLLLAWYTRSPLYIVLFTAAFVGSGFALVSPILPSGVTLAGALGVIVIAVLVLASIERFRTRDVLWTSASFVLSAVLLLAGVVSRLPITASTLAVPRARFALFADLFSRNGDPGWWDRARQVVEALYAQDAGGFAGRGLGAGTPFLIPNASSDYVFSALVEELGAAGGVLVIVSYCALVAIGLRIAIELGRTSFAGLIVASMTMLIGVQALIHIAGNLNVLPMTGITLPLVSAGGSSMLVSCTMTGMIVAMASDVWKSRLAIR